MNTITLKLTKSEHRLLQNLNSHPFARSNKLEGLVSLNIVEVGADVLDADKFREFLRVEIKELNRGASLDVTRYDILKSILSKLDKAVDEDIKWEIENIELPENYKENSYK